MKRTEAFPPTYLSQKDLTHPHVAIVKAVGREMMTCNDGGEQEKPVVSFQNGTKPLVLNMINWQRIEEAYGEDSDDWIGKPLELFVDPNIMYGKNRVGGIRIRIPSPAVDKPLTWEEAHALVAQVGLTRHQLVDHLKKHGRTGYNSKRDSALVHELLKERRAQSPQNGEPVYAEEDIPF